MKSMFPIPVIDELLDELSNASWFTFLDLKADFNQINLLLGKSTRLHFRHIGGTLSSQLWLPDLPMLLIHFRGS